jgi:hypothetical protein
MNSRETDPKRNLQRSKELFSQKTTARAQAAKIELAANGKFYRLFF